MNFSAYFRKMGIYSAVALAALLLVEQKAYSAPNEAEAIKIFTHWKCNNCHSILSSNIEVVKGAVEEKSEEEEEPGAEKREPPDLSGVGKERDAKWISQFMKKKIKLDGRKHGKRFKGTDAELETLATWLETLKNTVNVPKKK